jgi:hypothetical protein
MTIRYKTEFIEYLLHQIWRDAENDPRLEKALVAAGVRREFPNEKDYFFTTRPKRKSTSIH